MARQRYVYSAPVYYIHGAPMMTDHDHVLLAEPSADYWCTDASTYCVHLAAMTTCRLFDSHDEHMLTAQHGHMVQPIHVASE